MSPSHFCPSLDLAPNAERELNQRLMAGVVRAVLTAVPASTVRWMRVVANPLSSTKEVYHEQSFRLASLRPISSSPSCGHHVQSAVFQRSSTNSGPERFPEDRRSETGKTSASLFVHKAHCSYKYGSIAGHGVLPVA